MCMADRRPGIPCRAKPAWRRPRESRLGASRAARSLCLVDRRCISQRPGPNNVVRLCLYFMTYRSPRPRLCMIGLPRACAKPDKSPGGTREPVCRQKARKWKRRCTRTRRDNANAGRPDIRSGPSRWPRMRAICVHPFLSVCICVSTSCCLSKRENRDLGRNAPVQAPKHATGSSTAATVVTLFAINDRPPLWSGCGPDRSARFLWRALALRWPATHTHQSRVIATTVEWSAPKRTAVARSCLARRRRS